MENPSHMEVLMGHHDTIYKRAILHGYVTHNQRVNLKKKYMKNG